MIHVGRDGIDESGKVVRPNDAWFDLAADTTAKAIAEKNAHKADRAVYGHAEVKRALERLFQDKCAYCESKMTATADWDVEHFRPKGRVAEREDHPGYYWLTYTWENLYPSCPHCNQRRADRPRWDDLAQLGAGGKADQFPLLDESTRAMGPDDDVHGEHAVLIDPCFDDPEEYLGYDPTGQIFALDDNPYGEKSIDVMHLTRRRLRDGRRETIVLVTSILKLIANDGVRANAGASADFRELIDSMQSSRSEYSGLARYVVANPSDFGVGSNP